VKKILGRQAADYWHSAIKKILEKWERKKDKSEFPRPAPPRGRSFWLRIGAARSDHLKTHLVRLSAKCEKPERGGGETGPVEQRNLRVGVLKTLSNLSNSKKQEKENVIQW